MQSADGNGSGWDSSWLVARRCALDLVANTEAITWACQPGRSRKVRELGMMLAWLSKTLNA